MQNLVQIPKLTSDNDIKSIWSGFIWHRLHPHKRCFVYCHEFHCPVIAGYEQVFLALKHMTCVQETLVNLN